MADEIPGKGVAAGRNLNTGGDAYSKRAQASGRDNAAKLATVKLPDGASTHVAEPLSTDGLPDHVRGHMDEAYSSVTASSESSGERTNLIGTEALPPGPTPNKLVRSGNNPFDPAGAREALGGESEGGEPPAAGPPAAPPGGSPNGGFPGGGSPGGPPSGGPPEGGSPAGGLPEDGPPLHITDADGTIRPNPAYVASEHDLVRPPGVPDHARYVVNFHYRHGETNANAGAPMFAADGTEVPAAEHLINTDGEVVPGRPWFAGNKLPDPVTGVSAVQLLPASRASAALLRPAIQEIAPHLGFIAHSPVQRAVETMDIATEGVEGLPPKTPMADLAERGVGGLFGAPKTKEFGQLTAAYDYEPPPAIPIGKPGGGMPDVTPGESVNTFLERQERAADQLHRMNLQHGNGMTFSHQYTIAGIQEAQYKMSTDYTMTANAADLGVPEGRMRQYGDYDEETNPNGLMDPMTLGHHIPNGATLARAGWVWEDESGKVQYVAAPKGYSNLKAPKAAPSAADGPAAPLGGSAAPSGEGTGAPVPPAAPAPGAGAATQNQAPPGGEGTEGPPPGHP